ncbi:hypothetical protein P7C70_g1760, partial [Phenoliferia sp. Uapishka_3]
MQAATEAKEKGNAAFKLSNFPIALQHYSEAIALKDDDPTFYSNRAAVYLKLERWADAEEDAAKTVNLTPGNTKALFRRAVARRMLGNYAGARDDLKLAKSHGAGDEVEAELKLLLAAISKSPSNGANGKASKVTNQASKASSPNSSVKNPAKATAALPPGAPVTTSSAPPEKDFRSPSTSRLRAAISPPTSSTSPPDPQTGSSKNEFLNEVSTRRTSSFADQKANRQTRESPLPARAGNSLTQAIESGPPLDASAPPSAMSTRTRDFISVGDITPPTFQLPISANFTSPRQAPPPTQPRTSQGSSVRDAFAARAPSTSPGSAEAPTTPGLGSTGEVRTGGGFDSQWAARKDPEDRRNLLFVCFPHALPLAKQPLPVLLS